MVFVGDSITEGYPPSGTPANLPFESGWQQLLAAKLRARFPTTGAAGSIGYVAAGHGLNIFPANYPLAFNLGVAATSYGLGLRNRFLNAANARIVLTVPTGTTTVRVFWGRETTTTSFSWKINAGLTTNVSTAGSSSDFQYTDITGIFIGGDTVTIEYVSGAGVFIDGFYVFAGDETKGIRLWDSARASITTADFIVAGTQRWFRAFNVIQPSLVAIELGVNDASVTSGNKTVAQVTADIQSLLTLIRAQITNSPSIVLCPVWLVGTPRESWSAYVDAMYAVAAADADICIFDWQDVIWKAASTDTAAGMLPDQTHPGIAGSEVIAAAWEQFLIP
jgi:lysophospholipase L1-like esterase